MSRSDRFSWALSFLDIFTCALGGVFILVVLSVRQRHEFVTNEPAGYIFLAISYDDQSEAGHVESANLPGFDDIFQRKKGSLLLVSVRLPRGAEGLVRGRRDLQIVLSRKPRELRGGNERGPLQRWTSDSAIGTPLLINGRHYEGIQLTWKS